MLSKPATMLLGLIYEKPLNAYEIIKHLNYMNVNGGLISLIQPYILR